MLKTTIKTALRIIWKERTFSFLNVLGLTVGITASMLLIIYIQSQKLMDQFHNDLDRVYQVMENQDYSGSMLTTTSNPGPLKDAMKESLPEIEHFAQFTWEQERLFTSGDQIIKGSGRVASKDFFHVFTVHFLEGSKTASLEDRSTVYISQSLKRKLFGDNKAIDEIITVNEWGEYKVGGVFGDVSINSSLVFDFIMPMEPWLERNTWLNAWGNNGLKGIVKLQTGVDINDLNNKIKNFIKQRHEESVVELFLYPYKDMYLRNNWEDGVQSGGRVVHIQLFSYLAIFILIIASINYMNLSTAKSMKRAKEICIKKVVGSSKLQLTIQFMCESIFTALISALLSGLFILLLLPVLSDILTKEININLLDPVQLGLLFSIGLIVGILSGIYPSLILSRYKSISILKGNFRDSRKSGSVRKSLVVFQFFTSSLLIVSSLIIHQQMLFIKSKNLGFNKENIVYMPIEGDLTNESRLDLFADRIKANPIFTNTTTSSNIPLEISNSTPDGFAWEGKNNNEKILFNVLLVGHDYFEMLEIEFKEGRAFDSKMDSDPLNVIINEEAARLMGVEDPLNLPVTFWGRQGQVIGIVKDFHFMSLHETIEPLVISLRPERSSYFITRLKGENTEEGLDYLRSISTEMNPGYPFTYGFLEDSFESHYESENVIEVLANYFAGIAIVISFLGVFGLASFSAEQKIKEIGIRKVLGADVFNLTLYMSRSFLLLVGIGFLISVPFSYWMMNNWLNDFGYRIDIGASVFVFAGLASLTLTIMTVGYQSFKAANMNPSKSLKYQ